MIGSSTPTTKPRAGLRCRGAWTWAVMAASSFAGTFHTPLSAMHRAGDDDVARPQRRIETAGDSEADHRAHVADVDAGQFRPQTIWIAAAADDAGDAAALRRSADSRAMPVITRSICDHIPNVTAARVGALEIAVARQRPEREELRIAVVAQIEHARKPRRSVTLLVPKAIGTLRRRQVIDAARDRRMRRFAGRHQAEQGPRRLRGGTRRRLVAW